MKTPTLSPETERELLDELTDVFENNDDGGHYEYRSFVPIDLESIKRFIAKVEQRAIKTTLERVDESIETAKESILLETACEPDGYDLWVKNTEELEKILDQALSTLKQELLESE